MRLTNTHTPFGTAEPRRLDLPARLWSVLTVHGLAERSTILGPAVALFAFKLRER
jgi:hypothetical protein